MFPVIPSSVRSACVQVNAVRTYAGRIEARFPLPSRPIKKIAVGKARPAIYHRFNTYVELSDGSIIERKSQYPKDEYKMISDQRNNPIWNKSKPNMSLLDAESRGKLNRFRSKFESFELSGMTTEEIDAQKAKELDVKKQIFEGTLQPTEENTEDDIFMSLLGENYEERKLGGKVLEKQKKSKKNRR